jgi:hypothetical protein
MIKMKEEKRRRVLIQQVKFKKKNRQGFDIRNQEKKKISACTAVPGTVISIQRYNPFQVVLGGRRGGGNVNFNHFR